MEIAAWSGVNSTLMEPLPLAGPAIDVEKLAYLDALAVSEQGMVVVSMESLEKSIDQSVTKQTTRSSAKPTLMWLSGVSAVPVPPLLCTKVMAVPPSVAATWMVVVVLATTYVWPGCYA